MSNKGQNRVGAATRAVQVRVGEWAPSSLQDQVPGLWGSHIGSCQRVANGGLQPSLGRLGRTNTSKAMLLCSAALAIGALAGCNTVVMSTWLAWSEGVKEGTPGHALYQTLCC